MNYQTLTYQVTDRVALITLNRPAARNAVNSTMLGGELDGVLGVLRHSREKGQVLALRSLALLSLRSVPQVAVQHWAGSYCFAAGFRRCLFSTVSEFFRLLCLMKTTCGVNKF